MRLILSWPWLGESQNSSSATTDAQLIWLRMSWKSSTLTPSSAAISSSVGARFNWFSSLVMLASTLRAQLRTERGTQSRARSSSMMEPRMREMA